MKQFRISPITAALALASSAGVVAADGRHASESSTEPGAIDAKDIRLAMPAGRPKVAQDDRVNRDRIEGMNRDHIAGNWKNDWQKTLSRQKRVG